MKKVISFVLVAVLALSMTTLFTACGGEESAEATYTIQLAHVEAEDRSTHQAALLFKDYIEEQTGGDVKVEIFANAELGGDEEITESVASGTIQMCLPSTSVFTAYGDEWGILDMPFLFDNAESAFAAVDGQLGQDLVAKTNDKGFSVLGFMYNGPRSMTNSKHAIYEPKDLKGLKMRVMNSPVFIDMFETLGASAIPMSFSELYTALQQNTVDGEENPPTLIYASNFHEVQKYLSLTKHVHNFLGVLINTEYFEALPEEYQTIVSDAATKYLVEEQRSMELEANETIKDTLTEAGMEINDVTDEQHQAFVDAMQPMYEKYQKEWGKDVFDLALSYNK